MSDIIHNLEINDAAFFDILGTNINISAVYPASLGNEPEDRVEVTIDDSVSDSVVYADLFGAGSLKKYKEVTEKNGR